MFHDNKNTNELPGEKILTYFCLEQGPDVEQNYEASVPPLASHGKESS